MCSLRYCLRAASAVVLCIIASGVAQTPPDRFVLPAESRAARPAGHRAPKADPSNDSFGGEVLAERILAKLPSLRGRLQQQPNPEALRGLLAPEFRAASLAGHRTARRLGGIEVSDVMPREEATLDQDLFLREVGRVLSRYHRIEAAEFHITAISVLGAGPEASIRTDVHYELLGYADADDQRRMQLVGEWTLEWADFDSEWLVREWRWPRQRIAESERPLFADVTERSLGHNDSYWKQIRLGVDHWRSLLDGAIGIDVYGHHGVDLGDIDGDGDSDLYVSQPSGLPNRLYRNGGTGSFRLLEGTFSFAAPPRSQLTSAALADYYRDGDLDLDVCSYRYHAGIGAHSAPAPYHDANNGPPNSLSRNRGDGTFEDLTLASGMERNNTRFSFAASWGDYDADGWPDLYVANDFGRNNLYRNEGDGTFSDVARQAGVEDIGAGMSAAWFDHDQDGNLDLYVGNIWSSAGLRVTREPGLRELSGEQQFLPEYRWHAKGNSLFRVTGNGQFLDVSAQSGIAMGRWAWSSDAFDLMKVLQNPS